MYATAPEDPVVTLRYFVEPLQERTLRLGWRYDETWRRLKDNQHYSEVLTAAFYVAACGLHLKGCVGIRAGRA
eukprot:12425301-Karenia_brevis.AAC.1